MCNSSDVFLKKFEITVYGVLQNIKASELAGVVVDVLLYGSFARKTPTFKSDVDLCVIYEGDVSADSLRSLREACYGDDWLSVDIHFLKVSDFNSDTIYNRNVRREGISLWKV